MEKEWVFVLAVAGEAGETLSAGRFIAGCEGRGVGLLLARRVRVSRELAKTLFPDGSMDSFVGKDAIGIILEGAGAFQKACSIATGDPDNAFGFTLPGCFLLPDGQEDAERMIEAFGKLFGI